MAYILLVLHHQAYHPSWTVIKPLGASPMELILLGAQWLKTEAARKNGETR